MTRNFDHRVETLFPVLDQRLVQRLKNEVLWATMADNVQARLMDSDGNYRRAEVSADDEPLASQEWLYQRRSGGAP